MKCLVKKNGSGIGATGSMMMNLDRILDPMFYEGFSFQMRHPKVDIQENDTAYTIEVELPGYTEDRVGIRVDGDRLVLEATSTERNEEEKSEQLLSERCKQDLWRSFKLPEDVDPSRISATLRNGLLTLELPKTEKPKPREIEIKIA